ncbi:MAG TPA: chromosome segregation protein SMC, partial [Bacteroides sp.]|nr:chromosome segregation protein SMC [Bacteroides sp.]
AKRNEETGHIARTEGIHVQFNSLQQKDTYLQENITRIEWDIENLQNEEKGLNEQLVNTADEIKAKEDMIARTKAAIEAAQTKIEECEKSIAALREKRAEVSEQNKTFFDKRENLANTISALDKECYRLNAAKEKLEAAKDGLVDYMWSEYEITYGSASQLRDPEMTDLASIKKTIASVKAQIRALGDVNVNAIEEYKDVNERYTFLSTQHDDLIKA